MGKLLNMEEVILLDEYIGNVSENLSLSENKQDQFNSKNSGSSIIKKSESFL